MQIYEVDTDTSVVASTRLTLVCLNISHVACLKHTAAVSDWDLTACATQQMTCTARWLKLAVHTGGLG